MCIVTYKSLPSFNFLHAAFTIKTCVLNFSFESFTFFLFEKNGILWRKMFTILAWRVLKDELLNWRKQNTMRIAKELTCHIETHTWPHCWEQSMKWELNWIKCCIAVGKGSSMENFDDKYCFYCL